MIRILQVFSLIILCGCDFEENESVRFICNQKQVEEMTPQWNVCVQGYTAWACYEKLVPHYCTDTKGLKK